MRCKNNKKSIVREKISIFREKHFGIGGTTDISLKSLPILPR